MAKTYEAPALYWIKLNIKDIITESEGASESFGDTEVNNQTGTTTTEPPTYGSTEGGVL